MAKSIFNIFLIVLSGVFILYSLKDFFALLDNGVVLNFKIQKEKIKAQKKKNNFLATYNLLTFFLISLILIMLIANFYFIKKRIKQL